MMYNIMDATEYVSIIEKRFDTKGQTLQSTTIDKYDVFLIPDVKGWNYIDGYKSCTYIYTNDTDHEVHLDELQSFCNAMRVYTNKYFTTWTERSHLYRAALTIPVIISPTGFSESAIQYVKRSKMAKIGEMCIPALVDLKSQDLVTLELFGLFGRLPVKKQVKTIKRDFSVF